MRSFLLAMMLFATPAAATTPLGLGDIFRLRTVGDAQIAPDGRNIAYVETRADVKSDRRLSRIWIVGTKGEKPREAAGSIDGATQPRWSNDGTLAFVTPAPNGSRIVLLSPDGRQRSIAVPLAVQGLAFAPDGNSLAFVAATPEPTPSPLSSAPQGAEWATPAFVADSPGFQSLGAAQVAPMRHDLYIIDAVEGASPRRPLKAPIGYSTALVRSGLSWTPDGRILLYAANPSREYWRNVIASDVFAADLSTGEVRQLSEPGSSSFAPVASPDGRRIAFLCWNTLKQNFIRHDICLFDLATGRRIVLPNRVDQRMTSVRWAPSGDMLLGGFEEAGRSRIARFALDGGVDVLAETGGGDLSAYPAPLELSVARSGAIAYVASDAVRPGDIALLGPAGKPRLLTDVNANLLAQRTLAPVEERRIASSVPGTELHVVITRPPDFDPARRYPLMVLLHGGRSLAYGPDFDINAQLIAAHGFVVAMPNYRSSGGFGSAFANSVSAYPTTLDEDVAATINAMTAQGGIDPERLYIGGGSGGGVITGWTIGRDHRFKGAAMWFPTVDWASNTLEAATGFTSDYGNFGPDPLAGRAEAAARSPLTYVGRVRTPTLLVVGDQDRITPMSQSIMFFNGLQFNGVPAQLHIVPDEPHGVRVRPSHELGLIEGTLAWFARFGSGAPPRLPDLPAPYNVMPLP